MVRPRIKYRRSAGRSRGEGLPYTPPAIPAVLHTGPAGPAGVGDWRAVVRRDLAVGLALYLGLVIIVDGFLNTGIYLPGLEKGSIRYSEICRGVPSFPTAEAGPHAPDRTARFVSSSYMYLLLLLVSALRSDPLVVAVSSFDGYYFRR